MIQIWKEQNLLKKRFENKIDLRIETKYSTNKSHELESVS